MEAIGRPNPTMARMATHLPLLLRVFEVSEGDVLEMGTGYFSTLILRWYCEMFGRELYSFESIKSWYEKNKAKPKEFHHLFYTPNFDKAEIERHWGLAFIDHGPNERRVKEIERLANYAEYIVIHDTQPNFHNVDLPTNYHYEKIWPLFKYRYDYTKLLPWTSVVSNFHNLDFLNESK